MKRIGLIVGILVLAIVAAGAMMSLREQPPKKERVDIDPLVATLTLEIMTANFEIRSQGTVRPRTETVLSAEVSGTIVSISPKFVAGGVFAKNETLLRIDPTNYTVAVDQAEALVTQRQIEHDGANKLRSQGYRAESEYASAVAALASARAESVRARRNLERTFIRLPYDGIVRAKETDLGQFVSTGTRIGVVFSTDYAEIRLPLTDVDLAFVDLPGPNQTTASGGADGPAVMLTAIQKGRPREWQARIVRTEGVVDEKSRVTYAVAQLADPYGLHNDGNALPVGTFVGATIQGSTAENIIRVPRGAVRGSRQLLFVDQDNKIEIRNVDIVRSDAEYSYLQGGAVEGERIVVSALEAPINGMVVRTADDVAERATIAEIKAAE
ncbi:MAG: efflux RND transporter periplasmic adaptor subunit [Proteobacteria bacterium]|nr:efflux RND transporter periplasmic adaptor subunit [Pseudomonadota bacterium]